MADEALAIMRDHAGGRNAPERGRVEGSAGEQILPVIVEEREVGAGGVRVSTKVTEEPVEQDVALRQERVDVERRTVDRPVQAGDQDLAFQERDIEVTATAEEPIVQKTARVVDEVAVRKDVDTRTETIRDTVRKTDVDVQRIPYAASRYQEHYQQAYGSSGRFEDYEPAYRYGPELRGEQLSAGDRSKTEPEARERWESQRPGTWERVKAAVRHAFERAKD